MDGFLARNKFLVGNQLYDWSDNRRGWSVKDDLFIIEDQIRRPVQNNGR